MAPKGLSQGWPCGNQPKHNFFLLQPPLQVHHLEFIVQIPYYIHPLQQLDITMVIFKDAFVGGLEVNLRLGLTTLFLAYITYAFVQRRKENKVIR